MFKKILTSFVIAMAMVFCFGAAEATAAQEEAVTGKFQFYTGEELYQKIYLELDSVRERDPYIVIPITDDEFKEKEKLWLELEATAKQREDLYINYRSEEDDNHQIVHYFIFQLN